MPYPLISIVTPSLNQAQFLEHTLRSVLTQNYPNLEYVVIDGGSTDGSVEIIKQYSPQLAYWISEPDSGHGNALNKGFAQTSGQIMTWLNSDDMYFPWTLEIVAEIFANHPEVNWITGISAIWNKKGQIIHAKPNFKNKYDFLLGRYAWIQQEGTFWRRSLWKTVGGKIDESYRMMVDGELWCRFFMHTQLHHVHSLLGGFRLWGGNRSRENMQTCHAEMRRCIDTMRLACDFQTNSNIGRLQDILSNLQNAQRGIPLSEELRRSIPKFLAEIGYDQLQYTDEGWKHFRIPFIL